jgi:hypothetical protein
VLLVSQHLRVHRIPHHVRDDAYAPRVGAEWRQQITISIKAKQEYFDIRILNASTRLIRLTKFDPRRAARSDFGPAQLKKSSCIFTRRANHVAVAPRD